MKPNSKMSVTSHIESSVTSHIESSVTSHIESSVTSHIESDMGVLFQCRMMLFVTLIAAHFEIRF